MFFMLLKRMVQLLVLMKEKSPSPPGGERSTSAIAFMKERAPHKGGTLTLVGAGGFGPPKSVTTDLQSAPFGRSGTLPCLDDLHIITELVGFVKPFLKKIFDFFVFFQNAFFATIDKPRFVCYNADTLTHEEATCENRYQSG